MNQSFMKEKKILPLVLTMAYPMVLSMLINSLYNIIDSYFVAKVDEGAMTALSLVFPLQNLMNSFAVGMGIGINAAVSFYLGAENKKKADNAVTQGICINFLHGIFFTFACILVMPLFLRIFTDDGAVINYGSEYSNVVFMFSAVQMIAVSFEKIFQSVGRMKVSMFCMTVGCIMNIILDPVMIFGFGFIPPMGVKGAALATGIGQTAAMISYIIIYKVHPITVKFKLRKDTFGDDVYKRIYAVGIPASLNMALPSLLITALNGILAAFSEMYILILGIYYKLQTFIYLTANGVVQGIRPLVGYNSGAGRQDRVKDITKVSTLLCLMIMAVGTIICAIFPKNLIEMFSSNSETVRCGSEALRIISCGFVVSAFSVVISGVYEGLGKGMPSLVISLIRYTVIIPTAFILSRIFGVNGVWNSFWIIELAAAIISLIMIKKKK